MPVIISAGAKLGRFAIKAALGSALAFGATSASAQELVHRFINPSFGGNPFNSDHLLGIANIDRPDEPEEEEPEETAEDTAADLLRNSLLTRLRTQITEQINDAKPGDSGEFNFGNQRVTFNKGQTETRVTFLNLTTGETTTIFIPNDPDDASAALNAANASETQRGLVASSTPEGQLTAEQLLSGGGGERKGPLSGSFPDALFGTAPLSSDW